MDLGCGIVKIKTCDRVSDLLANLMPGYEAIYYGFWYQNQITLFNQHDNNYAYWCPPNASLDILNKNHIKTIDVYYCDMILKSGVSKKSELRDGVQHAFQAISDTVLKRLQNINITREEGYFNLLMGARNICDGLTIMTELMKSGNFLEPQCFGGVGGGERGVVGERGSEGKRGVSVSKALMLLELNTIMKAYVNVEQASYQKLDMLTNLGQVLKTSLDNLVDLNTEECPILSLDPLVDCYNKLANSNNLNLIDKKELNINAQIVLHGEDNLIVPQHHHHAIIVFPCGTNLEQFNKTQLQDILLYLDLLSENGNNQKDYRSLKNMIVKEIVKKDDVSR